MLHRKGPRSKSMTREKHIFTLVCRVTTTPHPVCFVRDYGAVAHGLWTTNGSIAYVSRLTADYVKAGRCTVTDSGLSPDLDFSDSNALRNALSDDYRVWNATPEK